MKPESLLLSLNNQQPHSILSQINLIHTLILFKIHFNISLLYPLRLGNGIFLSGFPIKMLYVSLISSMRATCLANLIVPPFVPVM
jgi:hypothetical protein